MSKKPVVQVKNSEYNNKFSRYKKIETMPNSDPESNLMKLTRDYISRNIDSKTLKLEQSLMERL